MSVDIPFIYKVFIAFIVYFAILYKTFKEFNKLKTILKKFGIKKDSQKLSLQPNEVQKQTKKVKYWICMLIAAAIAMTLFIYLTEK